MSRKGRPRGRGQETPPAAPVAGSARRARVAGAALALAAVAAGAFFALKRPPAANVPAGGGERPSVLLVTIDTARADRYGSYGHAAAETRYLDRLASEGVRFETALSSAPITLPSHASIFTGLYPTRHGVRNNGNFYVPERLPTLATRLREQGYATAAFVSSFVLDRRYGLSRGFDTYDDRMEGASTQIVTLEAERRGDRTALALGDWLRKQAAAAPARPFFAWLHLYDPHEPYRPPQPFRQMFAAAPYDGEIAFDDAVLASVLDTLRQTGQLERTLVAVTSDHGESLGEHGEETHSMFVYEAALKVPLVLWRPGRLPAGRVVEQPVRLVDLAPTLLELAGAPALEGADGRSLVPLIEGRPSGPPPPLYAETYLPQLYMNWAPLRALRDTRFKLIDAPRPELYDLQDDPREERNLHDSQPQRAAALRAALEGVAKGGGAMSVGALDREAAEKLAALGYLGAGETAVAAASTPSDRRDPKDVIQIFNRLRSANGAVRERRFADALPVLEAVLREDPQNAFARLVMGSAYMGMGRWREAIPWYRRYLERVPTSSYAHHWLAICHLRAGENDAALREAEAALALDPRFSDARVLKGGVLASRGAYDEAIRELRQAVETDPGKPILRLDLAKVLDEAGRKAEARQQYDELLRLAPDDPTALTALATLLAREGDLAGAEQRLRRALELQPADATARFDLAEVLARAGRGPEARAEWQRVAGDELATPTQREAARRALADQR